MREKSLGPSNMEVAASLNNLAVLLKTVGANEEAEALYTRSISIKEAVLGSSHPQVHIRQLAGLAWMQMAVRVCACPSDCACQSICLWCRCPSH